MRTTAPNHLRRLPGRRIAGWVSWILLLLLPGLAAQAYGPQTVKRMTDGCLRLAPASLRSAMLAHRDDLDRGVAEVLAAFDGAPRESVVAALSEESALVPRLPAQRAPFDTIAYHFGRVAGLFFVLNDPLARGDDARSEEVRSDYFGYLERKLPLMVLAFDGYDNPSLSGDWGEYAMRRLKGRGRYQEAVLLCYFPGGRRTSSSTFDDRSNAFAVAQLTLSHGVSDAAKAWFFLWRGMNGDVSATPFYRPAASETASAPPPRDAAAGSASPSP